MNPVLLISQFLIWSLVAGLLGAAAMVAVMRLIARMQPNQGSMITAVGSMLTRSANNAVLVGVFMHCISGIAFGMIYTLLLMSFDLTTWPMGFFAGAFFGVFHGIVVSLALGWVAEQHPLDQYRVVSIGVAAAHFFGHIVYGAVVGLVIALAPL